MVSGANNINGMDDTRNDEQQREENVDTQRTSTASVHSDSTALKKVVS